MDELPRIGRAVPEIGDENVRELSLHTYRIIHELSGPHVYILAVTHKRSTLQAGEIARQSTLG